MMSIVNKLAQNVAKNRICTALGVKLVPTSEIVSLAKSAGYDSLFIDLEHSTFSIQTASQLCAAGLSAGITPFVRVPYQCGDGFVQRVLDGGAAGVIFPHISTVADATNAVAITKFPPFGRRSLTALLPHFSLAVKPATETMTLLDAHFSTVFLMVETAECLSNIESIAALPGVDVLLVGANDLSLELGILGQWDHPTFSAALKRIGDAAKKEGKVFGLAGLYTRPDICTWAVKELGVRYIIGNLDVGLLAAAAAENVKALKALDAALV